MLTNSKAFETLKQQVQDSMDYVLLSCHAVPGLNVCIKALEKGELSKLPDPDYFQEPANYTRLKNIRKGYKKTLGRFLLLSSFSYFEAYVQEVLKEAFDYAGGEERISGALKKSLDMLREPPQEFETELRKLKEPKDPNKTQKYAIAKKNIFGFKPNFPMPITLLSYHGLSNTLQAINSMRAAQIPDLLDGLVGFELSPEEKTTFQQYRNLRNEIAHGKVTEYNLSEAIDANTFFRGLAIRIDKHICRFFLLVDTEECYSLDQA